MKRFLFLFLTAILSIGIAKAQTPDMFNYQAVARNDKGEVISNQNVGLKISVIQNTPNGKVVYEEEHSKTTNEQGLLNLLIGKGTALSGSFSEINWSAGPYFLEVGIDESGGTSYTIMGTTQLVSVPYAKYADSTANSIWEKQSGNVTYKEGKVGIGTDSIEGNLTIQGTNAEEDLTIRDDEAFIDLNNTGVSGVHISGISFSKKGKQQASFYNSGGYMVLDTDSEFPMDLIVDTTGQIGINAVIPEEQLDVNGPVRIRDSTTNPEPGRVYRNSMPLAYASVSASGTIREGSYGIDLVTHPDPGDYVIILDNHWQTDQPVVNVSLNIEFADNYNVAYDAYDPNEIHVDVANDSGVGRDNAFSIVVYGIPKK